MNWYKMNTKFPPHHIWFLQCDNLQELHVLFKKRIQIGSVYLSVTFITRTYTVHLYIKVNTYHL